jgi:L-serine dehydratase
MISILDLFRIGIGPSSSHTVGPMRIAKRFLSDLLANGQLTDVARIRVQLQGSLALTGTGHGSPSASILGLMGLEPETINPDQVPSHLAAIQQEKSILLLGQHRIAFDPATDIDLACDILSPLHPNSMHLQAFDANAVSLAEAVFYSTGGGFIATQKQLESATPSDLIAGADQARYRFGSAAELLDICKTSGLSIADVILANEACHRQRCLFVLIVAFPVLEPCRVGFRCGGARQNFGRGSNRSPWPMNQNVFSTGSTFMPWR